MTRYIPDQSDRDALIIARLNGVRIVEMVDGSWSWSRGSVGNSDFATQYHAARDALEGLRDE